MSSGRGDLPLRTRLDNQSSILELRDQHMMKALHRFVISYAGYLKLVFTLKSLHVEHRFWAIEAICLNLLIAIKLLQTQLERGHGVEESRLVSERAIDRPDGEAWQFGRHLPWSKNKLPRNAA